MDGGGRNFIIGECIAEAFIIRMADDVLVGQSPPFHVVIE
jgi:hypothetical protein